MENTEWRPQATKYTDRRLPGNTCNMVSTLWRPAATHGRQSSRPQVIEPFKKLFVGTATPCQPVGRRRSPSTSRRQVTVDRAIHCNLAATSRQLLGNALRCHQKMPKCHRREVAKQLKSLWDPSIRNACTESISRVVAACPSAR